MMFQIKTTRPIEGLVPIWFGKHNRAYPLHEMAASHLLNILKMYHRMAKAQMHDHLAVLHHSSAGLHEPADFESYRLEITRLENMSTADWLSNRTDYELLYNEAHQRDVKFGTDLTDQLCDYMNSPDCSIRTMEEPVQDTNKILDELRAGTLGLTIID